MLDHLHRLKPLTRLTDKVKLWDLSQQCHKASPGDRVAQGDNDRNSQFNPHRLFWFSVGSNGFHFCVSIGSVISPQEAPCFGAQGQPGCQVSVISWDALRPSPGRARLFPGAPAAPAADTNYWAQALADSADLPAASCSLIP